MVYDISSWREQEGWGQTADNSGESDLKGDLDGDLEGDLYGDLERDPNPTNIVVYKWCQVT